mgnify:CR=1 FL=1|jgi:hypothetical protein
MSDIKELAVIEIVHCRAFDVERKLLSGYDKVPLAELSPIAFSRAIRVPTSDLQDWVKSQIQNGQYGG